MPTILFEDHSLSDLKPLSWSQPVFEMRCGIFNARERMELLGPAEGGLLLCREILRPLLTAPLWRADPVAPAGRSFWLNGRVTPRASLIATLYAQRGQDWVLQDDIGLLAASLPAEKSAELVGSWRDWEQGAWSGGRWNPGATIAELPAPNLDGDTGPLALDGIWSLVPATRHALAEDLVLLGEGSFARHPFGLYPVTEAGWQAEGSLRPIATADTPQAATVVGAGGLYLGSRGVELAPGTHLDTTDGPVILDSGVRVMPHCYLAGPLYLGRETIVKPGTRIFGETSSGIGNRLSGEIAESTFGDFVNKQHDGFIGHAVLGAWINLGAGTTCSDLKNNYGPVRVDLGEGVRETGQRFVGVLMGDHTKTAIGTLFNTGTVVGFGANIFGAGMPPKFVPGFAWGGAVDSPVTDAVRACQTAAIVMGRRNCVWQDSHTQLFNFLHGCDRDCAKH